MKLFKLITTAFTSSLIIPSITIFISSCGNKDDDTDYVPAEMEQYISDRTFSIAQMMVYSYADSSDKYIGFVFGTAWIISDLTKNDNTDYKYRIATNWHVTRGFDTQKQDIEAEEQREIIVDDFWQAYADKSLSNRSDGIINWDKYEYFRSFTYSGTNSDFIYDSNGAIDLYVCDVDFGIPSLKIRAKLDRINEFQKQNNYINKFVNGDDEQIQKKKKFVAGYPAKTIGKEIAGGKWETHSISKSRLPHVDNYKEYGHYITNETFGYLDISSQYAGNKNYGLDWMVGGASGSMLITEDYEVCGIYWGGAKDKEVDPTWFRPRFSIIWNNKKNFIGKWL